MTRSVSKNKIPYIGNGTTTAFSYDFQMIKSSYAVVTVTKADGTETTKTLGSDYSISVLQNGGTVTFTQAPLAGELVTIRRVVPLDQSADWQNGTAVDQQTFETALDKLTDIAVQLQEQIDRSPKFAISSKSTNVVIPELIPGRALKVNAAGTGLEYTTLDLDTIISTAKSEAASSATNAATDTINSIKTTIEASIATINSTINDATTLTEQAAALSNQAMNSANDASDALTQIQGIQSQLDTLRAEVQMYEASANQLVAAAMTAQSKAINLVNQAGETPAHALLKMKLINIW